MAVVGHAEIIVRAITTGVEKDIRKGFDGISKSIANSAGRKIGNSFADGFSRSRSSNMFGKISDGLKTMVPEAEGARKAFQSLVRTGYSLSGVLGIIVGAISSVVVSIGPLISSLLKALPATLALVNAFVALRVAMSVGKTAFGDIFGAVKRATQVNGGYTKSIKDIKKAWRDLLFDLESASYTEEEASLNLEKARNNLIRMQDLPPNSMARREAELELKQADLAYRRAKARTKDLTETVEEGFDAFRDGYKKGAGSDPFEGLNAAQTEFAKRLVELNPKLDALKLKMSEAFLKPLYEAVDIFEFKLLPIFNVRLPQIAGVAGDQITKIFRRIGNETNLNKIDSILIEMQPTLKLLGDLASNISDIFLSILDSTSELVQKFLTWAVELTGEWADNLNKMNLDGSLTEWFNSTGEEMGKWGKVFGNIIDGFTNMVRLTTGPGSAGEEMLKWFTEATETFANMFSEDPSAGREFFKNAMINTRAVFSSIGALIKEILSFADNPAIAEAFNILKEGAPATGELLKKLVEAGPAFATFIMEAFKVLNQLTDTDQINAFFDTLTKAVKGVGEFLDTPLAKKLFDNLGPVFATLSAIGVIIDVIKFAFQVLVGYAAFLFLGLDKLLLGFFNDVKTRFGGIGKVLKIAGWVGLIITVVSMFTDFYNRFADFRMMVDTTLAGIGEAFGNLFESLMELFDVLFGAEGLGGIMSSIEPVIKNIFEILIPFIGGVLEFFINGISTVVRFITSVVKVVMDVVQPIVRGIMAIFSGDLLGGLASIAMGIVNIFVGIVQTIFNAVIGAINLGIDLINGILATINNSGISSALGWGKLQITKIAMLDITGPVNRGMQNWLNARNSVTTMPQGWTPRGMALGGTVYPSPGGSIVNVAEAGRPERIEPLDPNGLSNRDKALIKQLTGGAGRGVQIVVNAAHGMDENEIATIVSRKLAFQIQKGMY